MPSPRTYLVLMVVFSAVLAVLMLCAFWLWSEDYLRMAIVTFVLALIALAGQILALFLWANAKRRDDYRKIAKFDC